MSAEPGQPHFDNPELGIERRFIPVGSIPIEIAGVTDAEIASHTPWTRWLHHWCNTEPGFVSWALRVDDIESVAARLGLPIRRAPSGNFSTVGLDESFETRYLPFFISWFTQQPSRGTNDLVLDELELQGDVDRWRAWLGSPTDLPVILKTGPGRVRGVRIRAAGGVVTLK